MWTFATDPGNTAVNLTEPDAGLPATGSIITVWTSSTGSRIEDLYDLQGQPIANGYLTVDPRGRYPFQLAETRPQVVTLRDEDGQYWDIACQEAFRGIGESATQAAAALEAASQAQTDAAAALAAVTRLYVPLEQYASTAQLEGSADSVGAWQDAFDAVKAAGGGTIVCPANATMVLGGPYNDISGIPDLTIDLNGATVSKVQPSGGYATWLLDRHNGTYYGAGVRNLVIKNGYFKGSFANDRAFQLLGSNHGQQIKIINCVFEQCQVQAYHTLELDGCDDVLIEDCLWLGYKTNPGSVFRTETINVDISQVGAGATVAPYASGLPCRNIRVNRTRFLPWTDPDTNIKYPAPVPFGSHGSREGAITRHIRISDVYVEDPPVDTDVSTTNPMQDSDLYHRGLFHIPSCEDVKIQARVVATDRQGSIRVVQIQSAAEGNLASGDPNGSSHPTGTFSTPNVARDIEIDVETVGFQSGAIYNFPVLVWGPPAAPAENVRIRIRADGVVREAVGLYRVDGAQVEVDLKNCEYGVRPYHCNDLNITGKTEEVGAPVRPVYGEGLTVGPLTCRNTTLSSAVIQAANGADRIVAAGVNARGFSNLMSGTIANRSPASGTGDMNLVRPV